MWLLSAKCDLSSLSTNFSYRIATLWNSFLNVSTIRSFSLCGLKTFKRSLKAFFLQMQNSVNADSWHSNDNDLVSYCSFLNSQCQELISNQPRLTHWYYICCMWAWSHWNHGPYGPPLFFFRLQYLPNNIKIIKTVLYIIPLILNTTNL